MKGYFHIPQSSRITGTSPSDCLVSYPGHLLVVYSGLTPLQRNSRYILQPQPTGQVKWFRGLLCNKQFDLASVICLHTFIYDF